jgi:hypothetical protein
MDGGDYEDVDNMELNQSFDRLVYGLKKNRETKTAGRIPIIR